MKDFTKSVSQTLISSKKIVDTTDSAPNVVRK